MLITMFQDLLEVIQVFAKISGYRLETGTAAELRLVLTITLTVTDTEFAVLTLLLRYRRR